MTNSPEFPNKKSVSSLLVVVLAVALALVLKAPHLLSPAQNYPGTTIKMEKTGFAMGMDDALQMQAAWRFHNLGEFNAYASPPSVDLSKPHFSYPAAWPPGPMLLFKLASAAKIAPHDAYKIYGILFLIAGVVSWTLLGLRVIQPLGLWPLTTFIFVLIFHLARGWIKLADMAVFFLAAIYWANWWTLLQASSPAERLRPLVLLSCVTAVALFFWHGAIYLVPSALLCLVGLAWQDRQLSLQKFTPKIYLASFLICIGIPLIAYIAVGAITRPLTQDDFFGHTTKGFFLSQIPLKHLWPVFTTAMGSFLGLDGGLQSLIKTIHFQLISDKMIGLLVAVPMLAIGSVGLRTKMGVSGKSFPKSASFFLFVGVHFGLLLCLLTWMSIRYQYNKQAVSELNMLMQTARYAQHLSPLIALAWIILLTLGVRRLSQSQNRKIIALGTIFTAVVCWGFFLVQTILSWGQPWQPIPSWYSHPAERIAADIKKNPARPHLVLDPNLTLYLSHGFISVSHLPPADLWPKLKNSRRFYLYAVDYHQGISTTWTGNFEKNRSNTTWLAKSLGLSASEKKREGATVYSGWVEPFPKGFLKSPPSP